MRKAIFFIASVGLATFMVTPAYATLSTVGPTSRPESQSRRGTTIPTTTVPPSTTTVPPSTTTTTGAVQSGVIYAVSPSIANDCSGGSTDQSQAINDWLATIPNGSSAGSPSVATFGLNACYHLDLPIYATNHSNIVYEGNGATFQRFHSDNLNATQYPKGYPFWSVNNGANNPTPNTNVTFKDMHVVGLNSISDVTSGYEPAKFGGGWTVGNQSFEFESAYSFEELNGLTVSNLTSDATYGDGLTIGSEHPASLVSNAAFTNISIDRNGRQGVAIATTDHLLLDGVRILHSHADGIDIEINADGYTTNTEIRNMDINARAVAIAAGGIADASNIYIHDNTVRGFLMSWPWLAEGNNPYATIRRHDWRVQHNTVLQSPDSDTIVFQMTDNIDVRDNLSPANGSTNPYVTKLYGVTFINDSGTLTVANNTFTGAYGGPYTADSLTTAVISFGNTTG